MIDYNHELGTNQSFISTHVSFVWLLPKGPQWFKADGSLRSFQLFDTHADGSEVSWSCEGHGRNAEKTLGQAWLNHVKHGDFMGLKDLSWWFCGCDLALLVDSHLMILDGDSSKEIEGIEEDTTEKSWLIDDELLKIATFFFGTPVLNQPVCWGTTDGFERC